MLETLKQKVYEANMLLPAYHLVTFTWGNVSGIDREKGLFVIKPSGVEYEKLRPEDMVVIDLEGNRVEGELNPSTDTPTHLELYRRFPEIGGVVHTHSRWATIWAQAGRDIPAYGTTHADYIYGPVPCCRDLTPEEVEHGLNPMHVPCVLARHHGPFAWGKDPLNAVHNAVVLEEVAMMAWHTEALPQAQPVMSLPDHVRDKHFLRKHGPNAYYGQR